jgi:hypothetical protein
VNPENAAGDRAMIDAPRSWKYRRRCVFAALAGAGAGIAYLIGWGEDNALHREIVEGLANVIWMTLATYVGGATADDWLREKEMKR